jgi:protein tyrosine/serine phosphatase
MGVPGELFDSLLLILVAPLALLGPAAARLYWSKVACRFFTVVEGRLYRSGAMRPDRLARKVREHGIRAVIDLRSARPEVEREKAALAEIGVKHFHLPSKQLPRPETVDAVLALLDQPENQPALIHCNHGVRRAAQFEAIYRIEYQRWPNERALSLLRWRSAFMGFRPGSRGTRFLRHYVPRRARPLAAAAS